MPDETDKQEQEDGETGPQQPPADIAEMSIITGALAPKLAQQIGVDEERVDHFQKDMDALTRLRARGIIPSETAHGYEIKVLNNMVEELTGKQGKFRAARRKQ